MAGSEMAKKVFKRNADELIEEINKIEEPVDKLVAERDALQKNIDEIQETSRDLKEAANVLMNLCGEEKPYDIPKRKEVVDYLKPGRGRTKKVCGACDETVYVPHPKKNCPLEGCKGKVEKPEPASEPEPKDDPEDDLESDDDIDLGPERSDPPMPDDDDSWRRPGPGLEKKGCNRCNRPVYVLPHCTICPDEMCHGHLVDVKK